MRKYAEMVRLFDKRFGGVGKRLIVVVVVVVVVIVVISLLVFV